jgi:hypothetical protein
MNVSTSAEREIVDHIFLIKFESFGKFVRQQLYNNNISSFWFTRLAHISS